MAHFLSALMVQQRFLVVTAKVSSTFGHFKVNLPVYSTLNIFSFDYPLSGKSRILEICMSYLRLLEVCDTMRV